MMTPSQQQLNVGRMKCKLYVQCTSAASAWVLTLQQQQQQQHISFEFFDIFELMNFVCDAQISARFDDVSACCHVHNII